MVLHRLPPKCVDTIELLHLACLYLLYNVVLASYYPTI